MVIIMGENRRRAVKELVQRTHGSKGGRIEGREAGMGGVGGVVGESGDNCT